MSVLSRKELRIVLCPGHAALLAVEHRFTPRGIRHHVARQEIIGGDSFNAETKPAAKRRYDKVLMALEAALPAFAADKPAATLILSNHFSRYMLIAPEAGLSSEAERQALAQHRYRELYGDAAKQWELRISPDDDGLAQLSSAVDRRLLAAARDVFARCGVTIASIQPHLMAAYNAAYPRLHRRSAWLALVEPGILFLALLQNGKWLRLRSIRIGADWQADLPRHLEREACFAGAAGSASEVLLMAPDVDTLAFAQDGRWQFRRLDAAAAPGAIPGSEWGFALSAQG